MKKFLPIIILVIILTSYAFAIDNGGVNIPELYDGLYPIKYSSSGDVVFTSKNDSDWYDYSAGKWANAVTLDKVGQMNPLAATEANITGYYVWIPRYAYLIRTGYNTSDTGRIDIRFLDGVSNGDKNGIEYYTINNLENTAEKWEGLNGLTYVGDRQMDYLVHPAFTFEEELSGIWVGKYEAGKVTKNQIEQLQTMPNGVLWQSINISDAFTKTRELISKSENYDKYNLYGLNEETNTHLIKATEYGAVIYLLNSKYGEETTTEVYRINNINDGKEYIAGYLEGTEGLGLLEMLDNKYKNIYIKDEDENIVDIKGSAYLETSNGTEAWGRQTTVGNGLDQSAGLIVKENAYGSIASTGQESDVGFRVVITKGENNNELKEAYEKDGSYWWLMENGDVWVMGNNDYGQLGTGFSGDKLIPIKVEKDKSGKKLEPIEKIVCIDDKIYYISTTGTRYLNGIKYEPTVDIENDSINIMSELKKEQLEEYNTLEDIKSIYGNSTSTIIEEVDGDIYVIGNNTNNKLGIDGIANVINPTLIGARSIKDVGVGNDFSVFLKDDGSILGYGNLSKSGNGLTGISQIAVQENKAYFMKLDGKVIDNQNNVIATNAYKIVAGTNHLVILKNDGTIESIGQRQPESSEFGNNKVINVFAGKDMTVYITENNQTYMMRNVVLTKLTLNSIVYAELNGTRPYFLTYNRELLYENGDKVTVSGSEVNGIREIKGDVVLTEKNQLYNFNKKMNYIKTEEDVQIKVEFDNEKILNNYRIYGNSVQNETLTLEEPIEIESVGDKIVNLFDESLYATIEDFAYDTSYSFYKMAYIEGLKPYTPYYVKIERLNNTKPNTVKTVLIISNGELFSATSRNFTVVSHPNDLSENNNSPHITDKNGRLTIGISTSATQEQLDQIWENTNVYIQEKDLMDYQGKYSLPVKIRGTNLLREDVLSSYTNGYGITYEYEGNGIFHVYGKYDNTNGTSSVTLKSGDYKMEIPIMLDNYYTLSARKLSGFNNSKLVPYLGLKSDTTAHKNWLDVSIKPDTLVGEIVKRNLKPNLENATSTSKFWIYAIIPAGEVWEVDCRIQTWLEDCSIEKSGDYEPYMTITNIYLDEPLRKVGKYADYIDFENQRIVRKIAVEKLSSEWNWGNYLTAAVHENRFNNKGVGKYSVMSNYGKSVSYTFSFSNSLNNRMQIRYSWFGVDGVEGIKSKLAQMEVEGKDFVVYYPTQNERYEDIELPGITMHKGTNIITVDTEIQPSNIMISYEYEGNILD